MGGSKAPYYSALPNGDSSHELEESASLPYQDHLGKTAEVAPNYQDQHNGLTATSEGARQHGDNHHFAGLLEAVAADQEAARSDLLRQSAGEAIASMNASQDKTLPLGPERGKTRRTSTPVQSARAKRAKPSQECSANDDSAYQQPPQARESTSTDYAPQHHLIPTSALFPPRRSTSSSSKREQAKKQTRAPISQLYTSLHLPPAVFLELQSAGKAYMLDPRFPERRDCVGSRSKNDDAGGTSGDVRLRLWGVTKRFLEEGGVGERVFSGEALEGYNGSNADGEEQDGEDADHSAGRRYIWPGEGEKIITLLMPLLRRMVTNERQRQYAVQTRGGGNGASSGKRGKSTTDEDVTVAATDSNNTVGLPEQQQPPDSHIDPSITLTPFQNRGPTQAAHNLSSTVLPPKSSPGVNGTAGPRLYQLHILHRSTQTYLIPRIELVAHAYPDLFSMKRYVAQRLDGMGEFRVKIHGLDGLVDIVSDEDWVRVLGECRECVWMEGVVRVVVDVE